MEFDLSNFQVWKIMEKGKQSMEKYLQYRMNLWCIFSLCKNAGYMHVGVLLMIFLAFLQSH